MAGSRQTPAERGNWDVLELARGFRCTGSLPVTEVGFKVGDTDEASVRATKWFASDFTLFSSRLLHFRQIHEDSSSVALLLLANVVPEAEGLNLHGLMVTPRFCSGSLYNDILR